MNQYIRKRRKKPIVELTAQEWYNRIKTLPSDIQPVITKIVWWDYESQKTRATSSPILNEMRDMPLGNIPEIDQIKALIKIGYTAHQASKRVGCRYD